MSLVLAFLLQHHVPCLRLNLLPKRATVLRRSRRYCVAVKVACSYAMLCHVTKVALKDLAFGYGRTLSWPEHVTLTAMFVAVTMVRLCLSIGATNLVPSHWPLKTTLNASRGVVARHRLLQWHLAVICRPLWLSLESSS